MRRWNHVIGLLAAVVLVAAPVAVSADVSTGLAAYHDGDYEAALKNFVPEAEKGDPLAQTALGIMYQNGRGVKRDFAKAKAWYEKAAEQGDEIAQNNLAYMYWKGQGVTRDDTRAAELFGLATVRGYGLAAYHLADMYWKGQGVEKNLLRAFVLYTFSMDRLNSRQKGKAEMQRQAIAKSLSEDDLKKAEAYLEALRHARDNRAVGAEPRSAPPEGEDVTPEGGG